MNVENGVVLPGEAAAESLGLFYRVRSSEELHPGYIRNLIFLEEYFFDCVVPNGALAHILEAVEATPGITLSALREQDEHLRVDHVYALIARYHMEDENDCQAFRNAFSSLLKQIPLQVDHDTLIQR